MRKNYVGLQYSDDFNCWMLVREVLKEECGIELPTYGDVSVDDLSRVTGTMVDGADMSTWREVFTPRKFDVVVMYRYGSREPGHVGVMVDDKHVLHTEKRTDAVIVPLTHHSIRRRIYGVRRHEKLCDGGLGNTVQR